MGHRALVAYERPTDGFTVRYSQWGAHGYRLLESVTESTPLGGSRGEDGSPRVRPGPLGCASDLEDLASSHVDPLAHEAVFVVSPSFCVRAFEPLAFWGVEPTTAYGGALVSLRRERDPEQDASQLRAWRRGATATTLDRSEGDDEDGTDTREHLHDVLFDALDREVRGRSLAPIPPATRVG